jgi:hypothetical protein
MMKLPAAREARGRKRAAASPGASASTAGAPHGPLFDALRRYRLELARAAGAAPYTIFHDSTLAEIAAARPASLEALGRCYGVGGVKLARHGQAVLEIVRQFVGTADAPPAAEVDVDDPVRPNQGTPWSRRQDELLRRRWDEGATVSALADELGRGHGGIESRLVRLGIVPDRETARLRG